MASLSTYQAPSPAKDLHTSKGSNTRAFSTRRLPNWWLGTWNQTWIQIHCIVITNAIIIAITLVRTVIKCKYFP